MLDLKIKVPETADMKHSYGIPPTIIPQFPPLVFLDRSFVRFEAVTQSSNRFHPNWDANGQKWSSFVFPSSFWTDNSEKYLSFCYERSWDWKERGHQQKREELCPEEIKLCGKSGENGPSGLNACEHVCLDFPHSFWPRFPGLQGLERTARKRMRKEN